MEESVLSITLKFGNPPARAMRRRRADIDTETLVRLYEEGLSLNQVGKQCGIDPRTVKHRLIEEESRRGVSILRRRRQRTSDDELASLADQMVQRYEAGESLTQIAEAFGVSENAVTSRLNAAGVELRRRGPMGHALDEQAIVDAYLAGKSHDQIADELQVSYGTVYARLRAAGIQSRPGVMDKFELDLDDIKQRYEHGEAIRDIARAHGVSEQVILDRVRELGIYRPRIAMYDYYEPAKPVLAVDEQLQQLRQERLQARAELVRRRAKWESWASAERGRRRSAARAEAVSQATREPAAHELSLDERLQRRRQLRDASSERGITVGSVVRVLLDAGFDVQREVRLGNHITQCVVGQLCIELHYSLNLHARERFGFDGCAKAFVDAGYNFLALLAPQKRLYTDNDLDLVQIVDEYRYAQPFADSFFILKTGDTPVEERFLISRVRV